MNSQAMERLDLAYCEAMWDLGGAELIPHVFTGGVIAELLRMRFRKWKRGHEASVYEDRTEITRNSDVSCEHSTTNGGRDL